MITAKNISKHFGEIVAVDRISFSVEPGEVFGFLGPNGAGKTTTIRMLSALIAPTEGEAWVAGYQIGHENREVRQHVGILTESPGLYDALSAADNLTFFAQMYEVENADQQVERYLQMLGLWDRRHESVSKFSKGMRQKLAIARALLHEPVVLFLDEPTSGLDPEMARLVRNFIRDLKEEGRTIFLSTHNLDEADRLCDRIAVIKSQLLAIDTPKALRKSLYGRAVVFHLGSPSEPYQSHVEGHPFVQSTQAVDNKLVVYLDEPEKHNPDIVRMLVAAGADIQFVGEIRRTLEDVYLQLVKTPQQDTLDEKN